MFMRWYTTPNPSPYRSMWERPLLGPSLFDDVIESFFNVARSTATGPRFVSREAEDGYLLIAEVPGMSDKDIHISVEDGVLTVSGERKIEEIEGYRPLSRERDGLRFSRSFSLSEQMDGERIEARMEHGVLTLKIPRQPQAEPRMIPINAESDA